MSEGSLDGGEGCGGAGSREPGKGGGETARERGRDGETQRGRGGRGDGEDGGRAGPGFSGARAHGYRYFGVR